jgi:hypothetical protein
MEDVYIDIRKENKWIQECFKNKDFVSIDELLNKFEELLFENEHLKEE